MSKSPKFRIVETLPTAARVFKALRSLGYDFNSAVADIVDNSIDARAKNISIEFRRVNGNIHFLIRDDGHGMTKPRLREAMRLGSDEEYDDESLGKFGMGLKTASLSQCRRLVVASNTSNALSGLSAFCWDIAHIEKTNSWHLLDLDRDDIRKDKRFAPINRKRGTIVAWEDMQSLERELASYSREGNAETCFRDKVANLKLHLRMTFHRFLDGSLGPRKTIRMTCNGTRLSPWDPFCRKEKHPMKFPPVTFQPAEADSNPLCKIKIQQYVLPDQSKFSSPLAWEAAKGLLPLNDAQGLYVYRENRIIHFGGWLHIRGKNPHAAYARTSVEFSDACDDLFEVDVRKRNLHLPASIFERIKVVTAESVGYATKAAFKGTAKDAGVHGKSAVPANKAIAKALDRSRVRIGDPDDGKIKVTNHNGSFHLPHAPADYNALLGLPVVHGTVEDGGIWKVILKGENEITLVLNSDHPFYRAVYDTNNSRLTKAMDAVFLAMAIPQICSGNESNLALFHEVRAEITRFLSDISKAKGFLGKGNFKRGKRK